MWGGLASVRDVAVHCTCAGGGMHLVSDIGDLELRVKLRALSAPMAQGRNFTSLFFLGRILYLAPPIPGGLHWSPGE